MKILFATAPGYGLTMPVVPLVWAAHAAGHEVRLATTARMCRVAADAGLPVVDVHPDHDVWADLMRHVPGRDGAGARDTDKQPPASPFAIFTETMTPGTIDAGREFDADLIVYTTDHEAGALAAVSLGRPALEVGNRVSWSMRDADFTGGPHASFGGGDDLRHRLGVPDGDPDLVARIDPRAPSMGGLTDDEPDRRDGVPWWPMRYVPFNGGAILEPWARRRPDRPRVLITLGTVVPTIAGTSIVSVLLDALTTLDVEVVLALGDADISDLGDLPDNVRTAGFLPLSAVLPTARLIIHHGGSGTTAAPLHYGVPQLVLPSFADNPMTARRVVDRGVGLSHDPATLSVDAAGDLVRRLLGEPRFAAAAREVSTEMAAQPSPADVVRRIDRILADRGPSGR